MTQEWLLCAKNPVLNAVFKDFWSKYIFIVFFKTNQLQKYTSNFNYFLYNAKKISMIHKNLKRISMLHKKIINSYNISIFFAFWQAKWLFHMVQDRERRDIKEKGKFNEGIGRDIKGKGGISRFLWSNIWLNILMVKASNIFIGMLFL